MGYKLKNKYDDSNNPQTPRGAFFEGLFAGTMAFMTVIGGWLVSLFCWLGMETSRSALLAMGISVMVGIASGIYMARETAAESKKKARRPANKSKLETIISNPTMKRAYRAHQNLFQNETGRCTCCIAS